MRLVRIGKFLFNPAVAPHLTGLEETIILSGEDAETFRRWLKRQDVVDWPGARQRGDGTLDLGDGTGRRPRIT
jgi:hypothetical protein